MATSARPSGTNADPNVAEVFDLVKAYARQETLGPLRGLGRYLAFGLAGAIVLFLGILFLAIGLLRLLQDETGSTFTGSLSWIPYLIVTAVLVVVAAGFALRITSKRSL